MILNPVRALARAEAELEQHLSLVADDGWDQPSACAGWTVGDLVDHVIGGHAFSVALLAGAATDAALAEAQRVASQTSDRRARCTAAATDLLAALDDAEAPLDSTYPHVAGDLTGHEIASLRAADVALHAWDLARSVGANEHIDRDLVAFVWTVVADDEEPALPQSDDRNGDLQARLLARTGRASA